MAAPVAGRRCATIACYVSGSPKLPSGLKLKRRRAQRSGDSYRSGGSAGELLVERSLHHGGHLFGVAMVVLSAALLGYVWYRRVLVAGDFGYGTNPAFWVCSGVLLAFSLFLAARLRPKQTIHVSQGTLRVKGGGRNHQIDAHDVAQLYVHEQSDPPYGFQVMLSLATGKSLVLVGNLANLDQARYLEHAIEESMALEDHPVDGEVTRGPADALPRRSPVPFALASLGLPLGMAFVAIAVRSCGQPIGSLVVPTSGETARTALVIDRERTLRFFADMDLSGSYFRGTAQRSYSLRHMPRATRIDLELVQDGEHKKLTCNPFAMFIDTSGKGSSTWSLYGSMDNCELKARSGPATLTARLHSEANPAVTIDALTVVPVR